MNDEMNEKGALFLAKLAENPSSPCGRDFEALFYPFIWGRLRRQHAQISERVARHLGISEPTAPLLKPDEVDEVAHDATSRALRRVRENAARFDPALGSATTWVIGASDFAFVEVAKEIVAARRPQGVEIIDIDALHRLADTSPTTEEHVIEQLMSDAAVAEAAEILTEKEWGALRLTATLGFSYAQAAAMIFGNSGRVRQIDGLLTRAKEKLRIAWAERQPRSRGSEAISVKDRPEEVEGTNE